MKLELSFIQTLSNYWLSPNTAEMQFLHVEQSQYVAWTILIQLEHFIGLLIYKANIAQRHMKLDLFISSYWLLRGNRFTVYTMNTVTTTKTSVSVA